ncbi:MAG: RNase adapter RapZ [Rhodocyclaceae bacterium]|nr:RNase adapter RapZ [Rhodocyclaceae bacterium]
MSDGGQLDILLITGQSGAGKSVALRTLEDSGWYCVDNIPAVLLADLVQRIGRGIGAPLAIGVDTRSATAEGGGMGALPGQVDALRLAGHTVRALFLEARPEVLARRFSETRRPHPLHDDARSLAETIALERAQLAEVAALAHHIDSSDAGTGQLAGWVRDFAGTPAGHFNVLFQSFGFKYGTPLGMDLVFDVRCLRNPHYDPALRPQSGRDAGVAAFLAADPTVQAMRRDIAGFLATWLPRYRDEPRSYLTVGIGCTGGRHRSVWLAERLAEDCADSATVQTRHRDIGRVST